MERVAGPGGVVASCVWDYAGMTLLRTFWDAAIAVAPEPAATVDEARRIGYRRPGELGDLWEA